MTRAVFADRATAGAALGAVLAAQGGLGHEEHGLVLGIPRGGVLVAAPVADVLGWPLDVALARKVGAPGNPELGLGAVGPGGVIVLDEALVAALGVEPAWLVARVAAEAEEVRRREARLRPGRPPLDPAGCTAVVVDDGVATGGTAEAVGRWLASAGAARSVLAVPVGPPGPLARLRSVYDEVVALVTDAGFRAVGQFYADFAPTEEDDVRRALGLP